nr:unnamed protein product [Callosobruchus chinensis]
MAEALKKSRKSNFSQDEIDILVSAIIRNYDLLYGEFSKRAFYKHERHRAWLDIVKAINKISPEKRTLDEVKNKWKKCQHLYRLSDLEMASTSAAPLQPEPVLQSQPLSPTKLKVTRQAARPGSAAHQSPRPTPPPPTPPPPPPQDVCLRWNTHHANMQTTFPSLLMNEQYVILSSCSPYFEDVLSSISPYQHPVLFMKDTPFWILRSVCDFMYAGEVNVAQNKLEEFLAVADNLKIKGLARTIDFPPIQEVKKEPDMKPIKEEQNVENREEKDKDIKDLKEPKETAKDIKDRKDKELKEKEKKEKEAKEKEKREKEMKEKEILQTKQRVKKRHHLPIPAAEMPILKSAKLLRSTPQSRQNIEMPVLKTVLKPSKTKAAFVAKKTEKVERKLDKFEKKVEKSEKPEKTVTFAPQKPAKESPSTSNIFDPMNLLKPVYEEVTKEKKIQSSPIKMKEPKQKAVQKKIKKRKMTEEREDSPPPVLSRKGTRSRPNRKVAKFYHSPYERDAKGLMPLTESSTIVVREPHTGQQPEQHRETHQDQPMESQMDQADPLMQMEIIKDEPVDMEENAIDIVENVVSYGMQMHEEEILGNYDINSMSKSMKIVNVADIKGNKVVDPLTFNLETSNISITNIHSLMEKDDSSANQLGFKISSVVSTSEAGKEKSTEQNCKEMGFQIGSVVSDPTTDIVPKVEVESTGTLTEESQDSISDGLGGKTSGNVSNVSEALREIKLDIQQQSIRRARHAEEHLNDEERLLAEDQLEESRLFGETISEAAEQTLLEDDSAQLTMRRVPKIENCDSTEEEEMPGIDDTDDGTEEFAQGMPTTPQDEQLQLPTQNRGDIREASVASSQGIASELKSISQYIKKEKVESGELLVETEIDTDVSYEQFEEDKGDSQDLGSVEVSEPGQPYSEDNTVITEGNANTFKQPDKNQPDDLHEQADIEISNEVEETGSKPVHILEPGDIDKKTETSLRKDTEGHEEVIEKLTEESFKDTVEENNEAIQDYTGEEMLVGTVAIELGSEDGGPGGDISSIPNKQKGSTDENGEMNKGEAEEDILMDTVPKQLETEDCGQEENLTTIPYKPTETTEENDEVNEGLAGEDTLMDTASSQLENDNVGPGEDFAAVLNKPNETVDEEGGFSEDVGYSTEEKGDDHFIEGMTLKPDGTETSDASLECREDTADPEIDKQEDVAVEIEIARIKSEGISDQPIESIAKDKQLSGAVGGPHSDEQVEPHLNDFADPGDDERESLYAPKFQIDDEKNKSQQSSEESEVVETQNQSGESYQTYGTDLANSSQKSDGNVPTGDVTGGPTIFDQETEATIIDRIEEPEKISDVSTSPKLSYKDQSNLGEEFMDKQEIVEVSNLSDRPLQDVASLTAAEDEEEIKEETLNQPYQKTDHVVSNNQEPMDAEQIGDLLSMNIERLSVEDQTRDVQCPMDIPSDILDDSTETPIVVPPDVLENLEADKESVLQPISDDVPSTKEAIIGDTAPEMESVSDIIGDKVPNVIPDDDDTSKDEDTVVEPPDPTQDLTQSSDVQPLTTQTHCLLKTSDDRTEASKDVSDTSEEFNVPQSVKFPEQETVSTSTVLNTSQDLEKPTLFTGHSSESLNFLDDTGHSTSEGTYIPGVAGSSSISFDIGNKEGCEAEERTETEGCDVNTPQQGEIGRLPPTSLSESAQSGVACEESEPPDPIGFNAPGFHIAQVVNQQFALNDEYRSCPTEQSAENVVSGSSDLESLVNDLTMIVGEDRGQPGGTSEARREDETNVIAESLENLLEK